MKYTYYKKARDKSWQVLIECKILSLPLDLKKIINFYDITLVPYSNAADLKAFDIKDVENTDGFSIKINKKKYIYFNDKKGPKTRRRFTIAHELGHCLLGHDLSKIKCRNSENDLPNDSIEEMQANVFARCILMPAIVLHSTGCIKCKDIMKLCNVSETSAKIREDRMKILEARNKFCLSSLEQQVYKNFFNFINELTTL